MNTMLAAKKVRSALRTLPAHKAGIVLWKMLGRRDVRKVVFRALMPDGKIDTKALKAFVEVWYQGGI